MRMMMMMMMMMMVMVMVMVIVMSLRSRFSLSPRHLKAATIHSPNELVPIAGRRSPSDPDLTPSDCYIANQRLLSMIDLT